MTSSELRDFAVKTVAGLVENSEANRLNGLDEKAWDTPVLGFAAGSDPLFESYKNIIGDFYWTPAEAMALEYPGEVFDSGNLSVISWILPQTEKTLEDQRKEDKLPAVRWIYARHYGEFFNEYLRKTVRDRFKAEGIRASAPAIIKGFDYRQSHKYGLASNWSERHTAFAAGLGTFSLSDGFITERGMAVRIGSVVVEANIEPDVRTFKSHTENCLWYAEGKCGACIKRCPAGAITHDGHDKLACFKYIREVTAPYAEQVLGAFQTPCGLCQAKVPCERRIPVRKKA